MKRSVIYLSGLTLAFYLSGAAAFAQHGGGAGKPGGAGPGMGQAPAGAQHGSSKRPDTAGKPSAPGKSTSTSTSKGKTMDELLTQNTKLAGKIHDLTGLDAQQACAGFKNLGQCVAAAHVAKNLDVPGGFAALKAKVLAGDSLGKAIEGLNPNVNAKAEAKKANRQARATIKETSS